MYYSARVKINLINWANRSSSSAPTMSTATQSRRPGQQWSFLKHLIGTRRIISLPGKRLTNTQVHPHNMLHLPQEHSLQRGASGSSECGEAVPGSLCRAGAWWVGQAGLFTYLSLSSSLPPSLPPSSSFSSLSPNLPFSIPSFIPVFHTSSILAS